MKSQKVASGPNMLPIKTKGRYSEVYPERSFQIQKDNTIWDIVRRTHFTHQPGLALRTLHAQINVTQK